MRKFYLPLVFVFIASCGTQVNYLGSSYPETTLVDVFVSQSAVKQPYEVIGKGYVEKHVGLPASVETIQRKAVKKAKLKGANAVVIEDYFLIDRTSGITTRTDSSRTLMQSVNINPTVGSGFTILFLKYK